MASNSKITIEIEKGKLIKTILISLGIILVCALCFLVSANSSEEYQESSPTEDASDEGSVIEVATKEAGEVSDDERKSPTEISIDNYLEMYDGEGSNLVLISRPTCQYCKIATPIIENLIYEYNIEMGYLNPDNMSDEDTSKLISSDDYFSEGYGTPLVMVVGDGKITDKIEGLVTRDSYIAFFKEYGFMEK